MELYLISCSNARHVDMGQWCAFRNNRQEQKISRNYPWADELLFVLLTIGQDTNIYGAIKTFSVCIETKQQHRGEQTFANSFKRSLEII